MSIIKDFIIFLTKSEKLALNSSEAQLNGNLENSLTFSLARWCGV
jgi:hypothetical protein